MQQDLTIYQPPTRMTIDQTIAAWLDEKRADSVRTANAYEETLKGSAYRNVKSVR